MAASGLAVTVLTPNGRRQTVKVSPNTPLLKVLEDVCQKHGFNPDDHGLKFQRTTVDLTLPWRFANLPNNAKLEMVTSTRKPAVADSQVRIALQMNDGSRLQGSFSCGQSLWEVVTHFKEISVAELSESGSTPVCVYMRDEVSGGEALKKATLKSLGLTGGSAIIRFLLKNNKAQGEENGKEVTETAAMPTIPFAKDATPSPPSQPDPASPQSDASAAEVPVQDANPTGSMGIQPLPLPTSTTSIPPFQQEDVSKSQSALEPKFHPAEGGRPEEDEEKAGPSGLNVHSDSSFIPFSGGGQRLGGPGAGAMGPSLSSYSSASSSSPLSTLTAAVESPKAKKAKSSHGSCTKRQTAAIQLDEGMEQGEVLMEPVERQPLIYHLDSKSRHSEDHDNLPDEFFEVTVDDVRKRFAMLKSERKLLEEAPLMNKTLREAQIKEKMEKYPKVVLRIQFPDRFVLQGFFRPLETVGALRCFVRSHLEDPQLSFCLFTTPPKKILGDSSATLFQADLFPGALVYFSTDDKTGVYLKRELLESLVSALQANESVASCMLQTPVRSCSAVIPDEPAQCQETREDASRSTQDKPDLSADTQAAKATRPDPGKVPKWLKLPGKK